MRLTVIGCGTAQPQPDTPASGLLVTSGTTRLLLDVGQGVISRLERHMDPRRLSGVLVGHLHADHYIDLVGLRYLFPWGERVADRLPVYLPPGGAQHMTSLAAAISERPTFFDDSFEIHDYEPDDEITVGELRLRLIPGGHYVPAWGVEVTDPAGTRLVYAGDTGPNEGTVAAAKGADLFVCEATLTSSAEDDTRRGHLTPEEALEMGDAAGVRKTLLVHYPSARRAALAELCATQGGTAIAAVPDLSLEVGSRRRNRLGGSRPVIVKTKIERLESGAA